MRRRTNKKTRQTSRPMLVESLESRALLHAAGILSGSVYFDMNGDGMRNSSEAGVPGVVVNLSTADASITRSTITDDNGVYTFDELDPGTYQISKRQTPATVDGQETANQPLTVAGNNLFTNIVLADDETLGGNNFSEVGLRAEFIDYSWFTTFQSTASSHLRETIAVSEERGGNSDLAASIRAGGRDVPNSTNNPPVAADDRFAVVQDQILTVPMASGVLTNDTDLDADRISAILVSQSANGSTSLNADGSFVYTPDAGFNGNDAFTYRARDSFATSNLATVTINVSPADGGNQSPVAVADAYSVAENGVLTVNATDGVTSNDTDGDGDSLTAVVVDQPQNGTLSLAGDGAFGYIPNSDFSGDDSFTYIANDGIADSNLGTVQITVTPDNTGNELFGGVTPGSFESPDLLGTRTDLVVGAPPISALHVDGDVDYTGYSNPPTYGNHHPFDPNGVDGNPGETPRATGIYTTEQPEEDLIHNLEHGHVWISYDPNQISATDLAALEQQVRDGSPNANGGGVGVILTPRAANDTMIALVSWAHLQTLDQYDASAIRDFVKTNRGHAPEGFITP